MTQQESQKIPKRPRTFHFFGNDNIPIAIADFSQEKSTGRTAPPIGSPVILKAYVSNPDSRPRTFHIFVNENTPNAVLTDDYITECKSLPFYQNPAVLD